MATESGHFVMKYEFGFSMRIGNLRSLYRICLWLLDSLIVLLPKGRNTGAVFVMRLDQIGDFVMWIDAAKEFRNIYPHRELVLLANKILVDFASRLNFWDEVWPFERHRFGTSVFYRLRLLHKVRFYGFDVVINPLREFRISDSIVRVSGANERIGSDGNETYRGRAWETRISDRWYTRIINATPRQQTTALHNFREFVNGISPVGSRPCLPSIPASVFDVPNNVKDIGDYYVLFIGSSDRFRSWPIERFAAITLRVWEKFRMTGVLCGGIQETQLVSPILRSVPEKALISSVGKTTVRELIGIISQAKLYIGNETGATHIASAVGCRAICIAGGGDFGYFVPYPEGLVDDNRPLPEVVCNKMDCFGCVWKCIYHVPEDKPAPCISSVSTDSVWEIVCKAIHKSKDDNN